MKHALHLSRVANRSGRNFTKNQTAAKALGGYKIKSFGDVVKGAKPASFIVGANTIKNGSFLKMYSNGLGAYSGIL
jgi:hypothetical protein